MSYNNTVSTIARQKFLFSHKFAVDFQILDNLLNAIQALSILDDIFFAVNEISLPKYLEFSTCLIVLSLRDFTIPLWLRSMHSVVVLLIGESNRIRTVPEYGHSRYLRNHKSYKKMFNE